MRLEKEFNAARDAYYANFGEDYPLMERTESVSETIDNINKCIKANKTIYELEPTNPAWLV